MIIKLEIILQGQKNVLALQRIGIRWDRGWGWGGGGGIALGGKLFKRQETICHAWTLPVVTLRGQFWVHFFFI